MPLPPKTPVTREGSLGALLPEGRHPQHIAFHPVQGLNKKSCAALSLKKNPPTTPYPGTGALCAGAGPPVLGHGSVRGAGPCHSGWNPPAHHGCHGGHLFPSQRRRTPRAPWWQCGEKAGCLLSPPCPLQLWPVQGFGERPHHKVGRGHISMLWTLQAWGKFAGFVVYVQEPQPTDVGKAH